MSKPSGRCNVGQSLRLEQLETRTTLAAAAGTSDPDADDSGDTVISADPTGDREVNFFDLGIMFEDFGDTDLQPAATSMAGLAKALMPCC